MITSACAWCQVRLRSSVKIDLEDFFPHGIDLSVETLRIIRWDKIIVISVKGSAVNMVAMANAIAVINIAIANVMLANVSATSDMSLFLGIS